MMAIQVDNAFEEPYTLYERETVIRREKAQDGTIKDIVGKKYSLVKSSDPAPEGFVESESAPKEVWVAKLQAYRPASLLPGGLGEGKSGRERPILLALKTDDDLKLIAQMKKNAKKELAEKLIERGKKLGEREKEKKILQKARVDIAALRAGMNLATSSRNIVLEKKKAQKKQEPQSEPSG